MPSDVIDISPQEARRGRSVAVELESLNVVLDSVIGAVSHLALNVNRTDEDLGQVQRIRKELERRQEALAELEAYFERSSRGEAVEVVQRLIFALNSDVQLSTTWGYMSDSERDRLKQEWSEIVEDALDAAKD